MSKTLMIKAMVLGAVACAFSATGFAADVQNGHGQGIADSTAEVNGAKHEAVRSSWMDRTDIVVGVGMKKSEESSSHHFHDFTVWDKYPLIGTSDKSKSTELNKLYYTLRHYNL